MKNYNLLNSGTSRIQELLYGRDEVIDYLRVIKQFPWIVEKKNKCILSPDSDGLLCGLLMSHYLDWQIIGFYDGKVLVLKKGESVKNKDTCFLDIEIFRSGVKSLGHHMLVYNKNEKPEDWKNFQNCIQPNIMRDYDGLHDFRLKYPLATIHLLIGILNSTVHIDIPESAICPLFFTDGTFQVLYSYPENVLNWLRFLGIDKVDSPLRNLFMHEHYTVYSQIEAMNNFFRLRDEISIPNQRGDRLRISTTEGKPFNITLQDEKLYKIDIYAKERIVKFITLLSELTGWRYREEKWTFSDLQLYTFTKKDFESEGKRVNGNNLRDMLQLNPLSWAMTSGQNIEYTLETPDMIL
ncbi:MAG: hypothetical protein HYZ34_15645 [Ignavibacteriae bacterium]|nr:hypothetical protein [Ignavibacteriota bacterium]